ncbi:hypothetical protein [Rhizobium halophytocola]|uniref:Uncharacterized protein n=1 Tax=Rhizobium halophytocola TaxID=735519 RepID=A0ABS4DVX8_9HYPH|nr:hypothetical protein [Rhizobium halophytocola]MBP1849815.1 hypothetical protein [Rhizobium halophytocola]
MNTSTHIIGKALGRVLATALLLSTFALQPALAGRLADAATEAERLAQDGKAKEAFETIRKAFGDFSATLPFTVGEASFVSEKPTAYGAYTPRENSVFTAGEPLITYVELIGLAWKTLDDGRFQSHFTVDLEVLDARGDRLALQEGFGNFTFTGRVRNQELYTHLTLDLSGASPGEYTLRYTLKDTTTGSTAVVQQPFTLKAP